MKRVSKLLLLVLVILMICNTAACTADVYKEGLSDYDQYPEKDLPLYKESVVYDYDYDEDNGAVELSFGTKDALEDVIGYYKDFFKEEDIVLDKEDEEKDEYTATGQIKDFSFEITIEEARASKQKYYKTIADIDIEFNHAEASVETTPGESAEPDKGKFAQYECLSAGDNFTLGLKMDGTVVATGCNTEGQCDVSAWNNVVAVSCGRWHSVGLKSDGTVLAAGDNVFGQCDVESWNDVRCVSAGDSHTVGLLPDGTVLATGDNDDSQCNVADWSNIVAVSAGGFHTVGLKADGTVVATGNSDFMQCSVGGWTDIVAIFAGEFDTMGLKADGTVVTTDQYDRSEVSGWADTVAIAVGSSHMLGVKADGSVVSAGTNENGERNVSDWSDIVAASAGYKFSVGLKSDGTAVSAGNNDEGQLNVESWTDIGFPDALSEILAVSPEPTDETSESASSAPTISVAPGEYVVTIKQVTFSDITTLGEVYAVDENGKDVTLSADYGEWFENGEFVTADMDEGSSILIGEDGAIFLADDTTLKVVVNIDGVQYSFILGMGTQFHYTIVGGEIKITVDDQFTRE